MKNSTFGRRFVAMPTHRRPVAAVSVAIPCPGRLTVGSLALYEILLALLLVGFADAVHGALQAGFPVPALRSAVAAPGGAGTDRTALRRWQRDRFTVDTCHGWLCVLPCVWGLLPVVQVSRDL